MPKNINVCSILKEGINAGPFTHKEWSSLLNITELTLHRIVKQDRISKANIIKLVKHVDLNNIQCSPDLKHTLENLRKLKYG